MTNHFWDNLLDYIVARRVVPIIGPELLLTQIDGREVLLHRYLAERLAVEFEVAPVEELPAEDALNFVVCRFLENPKYRREELYPYIQRVLRKTPLSVPEPLRKLARISHLKLFVTTTFDSLLEQALTEERPGEAVKVLAYAPNDPEDLTTELAQTRGTVLYHLLGRVSALPNFVITEEDTLEFFYLMQAEAKRPLLLFDELKNNHLLIIGSSFPDWLARFFIRIAKGGRLSNQREPLEIVADRRMQSDKSLVLFLEHFSYRTEIFQGGGAADFVDELARRYAELPPESATENVPVRAVEGGAFDRTGGSIFLSYASEDLAAAARIRDALVDLGWDVWFDKKALTGGDDFGREIAQNIRRCTHFLPLISARTRARTEGYFREEWSVAVGRSRRIHPSVKFIIPLSIDDTPATNDANVPEEFLALHWTRIPDGEAKAEFVQEMKQLLRDEQKRQKGVA